MPGAAIELAVEPLPLGGVGVRFLMGALVLALDAPVVLAADAAGAGPGPGRCAAALA